MNTYYIVIETKNKIAWVIRNTEDDMDTINGLKNQISLFEKEYDGAIVILNWKRLNKGWFEQIFDVYRR